MGSLRELDFSETDIIEVPSSIRHLHGLKTLKLSDCLNLVSLRDGICSLSSLQTLFLKECSKLKVFPDINIGSLKALKLLNLLDCKNLESLPKSICNLSSLKTLQIGVSPKFMGILEMSLESLTSLDLTWHISNSRIIWNNYCVSSLKALNLGCLSSLV